MRHKCLVCLSRRAAHRVIGLVVLITLYTTAYHINSVKLILPYLVETGNSQTGTVSPVEYLEPAGEDLTLKQQLNCTRKNSIYYARVFKTGSSTIVGMLGRYALRHSSLVALSKGGGCYPKGNLQKTLYSTKYKGKYNIFFEHCLFDVTTAKEIMADDVQFLATLRFPLTHLRSVLMEWTVPIPHKWHKPHNDAADEFLRLLRDNKAWQKAKFSASSHIWTQNLQSRFLGLTQQGSRHAIAGIIRLLEEKFKVIIINEYMLESLILLRRHMCWSPDDILFLVNRKLQQNVNVDKLVPISLQNEHIHYSAADYQLYHHFRRKLLRQIREAGPDFAHELDMYTHMQLSLVKFCEPYVQRLSIDAKVVYEFAKENTTLSFNPEPWGEPFSIHALDCVVLKLNSPILGNAFAVRQYPEFCKQVSGNAGSKIGVGSRITSLGKVNPAYCNKPHPRVHIPLEVLANPKAYENLHHAFTHI